MALVESKCPLTGDKIVTATGRDTQQLRGALKEVAERDSQAKREDARANPGALMADRRNGRAVQVNSKRAAEMASSGAWDLAKGARPCVTMPDNFNPNPQEVEEARQRSRSRRGQG